MTKISSLTALTGAGVDDAADLFPIVDMSEAGTARNKKITINEAKIALDVPAAITELDDIPDVNAPAPTNGDVLTWDSTPGEWISTAPTTGATTLDGLTDVNAPAPSNNDVLTWDSTPGEWVAQAPSGGVNALDDLSDVDTTGQTSGDVLTYDGAEWVPQAPTGGSVSAWKESVRAATTVAGTLATSFENGDTIDGVTLATGDRILIKNQAAPADNGIYTVNASGAPTRATDADSAAEVVGATVAVTEGTINAKTQWQQTTPAPITLNTTGLVFGRTGGTSRGAMAKRAVALTAQNFTGFISMIPWEAEEYDTEGFHDTGSNTSRLTIPSGVTKVRLSACVIVTSVTINLWARAAIFKTGSTSDYPGIAWATSYSGGLGEFRIILNSPVLIVTGGTDYFEVGLQVQTDTSVDIGANSWFAVEVIE